MGETFPERWGFEGDLSKCAGKTIERAETVRMEYGCTWDHAWVVRFTDGSRAFFVGDRGSGIMSPPPEEVFKSSIFLPEEYGEMLAEKKRREEQRARESQEQKRRQLERLKKELGE